MENTVAAAVALHERIVPETASGSRRVFKSTFVAPQKILAASGRLWLKQCGRLVCTASSDCFAFCNFTGNVVVSVCDQMVVAENPPSTTMFWPVTNEEAR